MSAVENILKNYEHQPRSVLKNLSRILNHGALGGTGKLVILPVDQGFEHGPTRSFAKNPKAYDPHYHLELAMESGCSAYAAPLGFIESCQKYASKIPLILKINNSDSLYQDDRSPIPAITSSVSAAVKLKCAAIGMTIYPGSAERKTQYEQVAHMAEWAKEAGLGVVLWSYPRGAGISKQGQTAVDVVAYAAHIACQLGAHIIKVKPPTSYIEQPKSQDVMDQTGLQVKHLHQRVKHVIQSAFDGRRIVIFSGGEARDESELLEEIKELKKGGAFGSIIGRNAFQRPKDQAQALLKKVMQIYQG